MKHSTRMKNIIKVVEDYENRKITVNTALDRIRVEIITISLEDQS